MTSLSSQEGRGISGWAGGGPLNEFGKATLLIGCLAPWQTPLVARCALLAIMLHRKLALGSQGGTPQEAGHWPRPGAPTEVLSGGKQNLDEARGTGQGLAMQGPHPRQA